MRARIAIVGGGILGLTAALLAANRGCAVTIYERESALFRGASVNNEGKVHLGLVYALAEPTTIHLMLDGALSFDSIIDEACGYAVPWHELSTSRFEYLAMPESLLDAARLSDFYREVNDLFASRAQRGARYLGQPLDRLVDPVPRIDEATGLAMFATNERAVHPDRLGSMLTAAVERHANISVRTASEVTEIAHGRDEVLVTTADETVRFDAVVNCAWEARQSLVHPAERSPLYIRYKSAIRVSRVDSAGGRALTLVIGPFGDVVSHRDHVYLSWYPVGRLSASSATSIAEAPLAALSDSQKHALIERQLAPLQALGLVEADVGNAELVGGYILAEGENDIDRRDSGLHHRSAFGTQVVGRTLTPQNYKLTTAPLAARDSVRVLMELLA